MKLFSLVRCFMLVSFFSFSVSCADSTSDDEVVTLDQATERYVKLGLQFGEYEPDYVDAYLGPREWAEQAKAALLSKEKLVNDISALYAQLQDYSPSSNDQQIRHSSLLKNMRALYARARMFMGEVFSFADEARLIYDVTLPSYDFNEFDHPFDLLSYCLRGAPQHDCNKRGIIGVSVIAVLVGKQ